MVSTKNFENIFCISIFTKKNIELKPWFQCRSSTKHSYLPFPEIHLSPVILFLVFLHIFLPILPLGSISQCFQNFNGYIKGKIPLGRPRRRSEDNTRMYIKEIGINTRNWVGLAQEGDYWRDLVNAALSLRVA